MRRITAALSAITLAGLLAACSSADPDTSDKPEAGAEPASAGEELQAAADRIGCSGYEQSAKPAPNVDQWGTCDLDGARIQLYYIPDTAAYDAFVEASSAFGVTEAWMARVGPIVAAPDDQTLVEDVRAALEG